MNRHAVELRLPLPAALGLLSILAAGCGDGRPRTYPVHGSVSFSNGTPVRAGTVEFRSAAMGLNARGKLDSSGRFQLGTFDVGDGAVEGTHRVIVLPLISRPEARQPPPGHVHSAASGSAISPKHARYETSGLTAEILPRAANEISLVVKRRGEE